jgi:hypothetical protein
MSTFTSLPLHDAVLHSVRIEWKVGECILDLAAFFEPGQEAEPCQLVFRGIRNVTIPRAEPWGPSIFINKILQPSSNVFQVEMQSGDVLEIVAVDARLEQICR